MTDRELLEKAAKAAGWTRNCHRQGYTMTAKTVAERAAALRLRRRKLGLAEVRGIWAPKKLHEAIKGWAKKVKV